MNDADREVTSIQAKLTDVDGRIADLETQLETRSRDVALAADLFVKPEDDPGVQLTKAEAERKALRDRLDELAPHSVILLEAKWKTTQDQITEIEDSTFRAAHDPTQERARITELRSEANALVARAGDLRAAELGADIEAEARRILDELRADDAKADDGDSAVSPEADRARLLEQELRPHSITLLEDSVRRLDERIERIERQEGTARPAIWEPVYRQRDEERALLEGRRAKLLGPASDGVIEQPTLSAAEIVQPASRSTTTKTVVGVAIGVVAVVGIVAAVALIGRSTDPTPPSANTSDRAPASNPPTAGTTPGLVVTPALATTWLNAAGQLEGVAPEAGGGVKTLTNLTDPSVSFDEPLLATRRFEAMVSTTYTRTTPRSTNPGLTSANYIDKVYILGDAGDADSFLAAYLERAMTNGFSRSGTFGTDGVVLQRETNVDLLFPVGNAVVRINMGVNPGTPAVAAAKDATDMAQLQVAAGATK
ncbi:MAG: hypothetical protein HYX32_07645 [Actinobacteria bacterium]|nr:hypothetical protein [Actinomycetota bacterium]